MTKVLNFMMVVKKLQIVLHFFIEIDVHNHDSGNN